MCGGSPAAVLPEMVGPIQGPESPEAALATRQQPAVAKAGGTARLQALVKRVLANSAAAGTEAQPAGCRSAQQQAGAGQTARPQAEGSLSLQAAPVPTPPAEAEPLHAGTAAASAVAAASGSPSTARPAAAVVVKTEDDPGAADRPGQSAAAQADGSQQALPAGSSLASGRRRWPVGVSQDRSGACQVRFIVPLDEEGRPAGALPAPVAACPRAALVLACHATRGSCNAPRPACCDQGAALRALLPLNPPSVAPAPPAARAVRQEVVARRVLSGLGAAAVARDLAVMWRQLCLGQPLARAREAYNHALPRCPPPRRPAPRAKPVALLALRRRPCLATAASQVRLQGRFPTPVLAPTKALLHAH